MWKILKLITHVNNLKKKNKTQLNYIKNTVFVKKKVDSKFSYNEQNRQIKLKALKAIYIIKIGECNFMENFGSAST